MLSPDDYVAIDFETSGRTNDSACAVGLVRISGGQIRNTYYTLIRPPSPVILFTWVHGLTWEDLRNAPTFPEVWPEMASFMDGASGLVAHNATFDRSVLYGCCESFGCPYPGLPFYDTLKGARRSLPPGSKSLDHVCSYFQIKLNHHQALSDAEACARIFVELQKRGLDAASMRLKSAGRHRARLPLGPDHPSPVR